MNTFYNIIHIHTKNAYLTHNYREKFEEIYPRSEQNPQHGNHAKNDETFKTAKFILVGHHEPTHPHIKEQDIELVVDDTKYNEAHNVVHDEKFRSCAALVASVIRADLSTRPSLGRPHDPNGQKAPPYNGIYELLLAPILNENTEYELFQKRTAPSNDDIGNFQYIIEMLHLDHEKLIKYQKELKAAETIIDDENLKSQGKLCHKNMRSAHGRVHVQSQHWKGTYEPRQICVARIPIPVQVSGIDAIKITII